MTVIQVNGTQSTITSPGPQTAGEAQLWEHATADQMGVIGNDFRGVEEIGSAAFERASNNFFIPDNLNVWFPQKQPHDHRTIVFFKRTLVGKVVRVSEADISGTFQDHDVDIIIRPNEGYQYLISEGHRREYTSIMSHQFRAKQLGLTDSGQPDCDDDESKFEFTVVEAEILPNGDLHAGTAIRLNDMILNRVDRDVAVYGPWIFDKGHCCHPEIHPAEQIWWRDDGGFGTKRYSFNVFCDASQRFWWRDQMDDGTKLKPWGAPPIKGLFAIAFEVDLRNHAVGAVRPHTVKYEVSDFEANNVAVNPGGNQEYNLVLGNEVIVTFIPHNDAFNVTFENVGVSAGKVRGFLVIETSVGTVTQTSTEANVLRGGGIVKVKIPPGTDVNKIDQGLERVFFEKKEGRYMFTVTETHFSLPQVLTT